MRTYGIITIVGVLFIVVIMSIPSCLGTEVLELHVEPSPMVKGQPTKFVYSVQSSYPEVHMIRILIYYEHDYEYLERYLVYEYFELNYDFFESSGDIYSLEVPFLPQSVGEIHFSATAFSEDDSFITGTGVGMLLDVYSQSSDDNTGGSSNNDNTGGTSSDYDEKSNNIINWLYAIIIIVVITSVVGVVVGAFYYAKKQREKPPIPPQHQQPPLPHQKK